MWRTANPLQGRRVPRRTAPTSTSNRKARPKRTSVCSRSSKRPGATFVHPFDDPVLQAGYGSSRLEIVEDVPDDGDDRRARLRGGGLIAGIASAVGCRVVGVEPELAPTMAEALAAGEPVDDPAALGRRRARRAVHGRAHARGRARPRRRRRARDGGGDQGGDALPLRPREARMRAGRRAVDRRVARRQDRRSTRDRRSSPSCPEATRTRRSLLLSSPKPDES